MPVGRQSIPKPPKHTRLNLQKRLKGKNTASFYLSIAQLLHSNDELPAESVTNARLAQNGPGTVAIVADRKRGTMDCPNCDNRKNQTRHILGIDEVVEMVRLSPSTIFRQIAAGTFPCPIRLSPNRIGWLKSEIEAWIAARAKERKGDQT